MRDKDKMTLATLARGAVNEAFEYEFEKAIENILDPNTEPSKPRSVIVELVLKSDQWRERISVECKTKSKLVPAGSVGTALLVGKTKDGSIVAQELVAQNEGQLEVDPDTGEIHDAGTIIEFKKAGGLS